MHLDKNVLWCSGGCSIWDGSSVWNGRIWDGGSVWGGCSAAFRGSHPRLGQAPVTAHGEAPGEATGVSTMLFEVAPTQSASFLLHF